MTLSSTEAEFLVLTEACKEAKWIKKLLKDLNYFSEQEITIYEDNTSCLKILQNDKVSSRTKHIDVKFYFIKDLIKKEKFICEYCPTDKMIADGLTKPLPASKMEELRKNIKLIN